jgi:hypothetical protein
MANARADADIPDGAELDTLISYTIFWVLGAIEQAPESQLRVSELTRNCFRLVNKFLTNPRR